MTSTPVSLLERLRHPVDQEAWSRFVDLYSPVIYSWGRQVGLKESDAADLAQDVFTILVQKMPSFAYESGGSFRAWLRTVTLNKWRENQRRLVARRENGGPVPDLPTREADSFWDGEYRQHVIAQALRVMQADFEPQTWRACWMMVVDGLSAAQVAAQLSLGTGTVYAAKCRVLAHSTLHSIDSELTLGGRVLMWMTTYLSRVAHHAPSTPSARPSKAARAARH